MLAKSKIKIFEYINNRNLIKKLRQQHKVVPKKKKSSARLDKIFGKKNKRVLLLTFIGHCPLDFTLA